MKRGILPLSLLVLLLAGCAPLEEGSRVVRSHYSQRKETTQELPSGVNRISTLEGLETAMYDIVITGMGQKEYNDTLTVERYEGELLEDAKAIAQKLMAFYPECAYTVSSITPLEGFSLLNTTEIRVSVVYHPERSLKSVTTVLDVKDLEDRTTRMLGVLSERQAYSMTNFLDTEEKLESRLMKCWANQSQPAVGLESIQYNLYPKDSPNVIVEISAEYLESRETLLEWRAAIAAEAQKIAEGFTGETEREKIDYIFEYLHTNVSVNLGAFQAALSYVPPKNAPYTAYGALVEHSAAQSGYVLGAKVLCDALGIGNMVIIGNLLESEEYREAEYYWLVVTVDGERMHFDVTPDIFSALAGENGQETGAPDTSLGSFDESGEEEAPPPEYLLTAAQGRRRFTWDDTLYIVS